MYTPLYVFDGTNCDGFNGHNGPTHSSDGICRRVPMRTYFCNVTSDLYPVTFALAGNPEFLLACRQSCPVRKLWLEYGLGPRPVSSISRFTMDTMETTPCHRHSIDTNNQQIAVLQPIAGDLRYILLFTNCQYSTNQNVNTSHFLPLNPV